MQHRFNVIRARCAEVIGLVKTYYGLDLTNLPISFDLVGKCAGMAHGPIETGYPISKYLVRFNREMIEREDPSAFDHILFDTVPHEIAHIVCFMRPELGADHDAGWVSVCMALGGSGRRTHSEDIIFAEGNTYEFTNSHGIKIRLNKVHYRQVAMGKQLNWADGTFVNRFSPCYIVGFNGKALAQPVLVRSDCTLENPSASVDKSMHMPQPSPAQKAASVSIAAPFPGESKASISRRIIYGYYMAGKSYEEIITAMMAMNGYTRQLARGTYAANAPKVGVPLQY